MLHGTSTAPAWMKFIDIARRMGLQPWDLVGGSRLLWYVRYEVIREMENRAMQRERNKPASVDQINARHGRR